MCRWTLLLAVLLATAAEARRPLSIIHTGSAPTAAGANWSPARATGKPDATPNADHVNAWATLAPDAGAEWLELEFARVVPVAEIQIHQSYNPGAVVRIEAIPEGGEPVEVWAGTDKARANILREKMQRVVKARRVRVHLNTALVAGWNEIDAVAVVGSDMTLQWAREATASSTYAQASAGPFAGVVGKRVRVEHLKGTLTGTLVAIHGQLVEVKSDATGRAVFVGLNALVTLEAL